MVRIKNDVSCFMTVETEPRFKMAASDSLYGYFFAKTGKDDKILISAFGSVARRIKDLELKPGAGVFVTGAWSKSEKDYAIINARTAMLCSFDPADRRNETTLYLTMSKQSTGIMYKTAVAKNGSEYLTFSGRNGAAAFIVQCWDKLALDVKSLDLKEGETVQVIGTTQYSAQRLVYLVKARYVTIIDRTSSEAQQNTPAHSAKIIPMNEKIARTNQAFLASV